MESAITNRLIGVEIELLLPIVGLGQNLDVQQLVAEVLTTQGIRACARGYSRQPTPAGCQVCVEHDSSIRDESRYAGIRWAHLEVKTCPMPWSELERVLPPTLDVLRYLGARVNYSCGLHVHHHLPEIQSKPEVLRSLWNLWWRYHKVIYGLTAPSRISNTYCAPPQGSDASLLASCQSYQRLCEIVGRMNRYSGLNLTNLPNPERQTVEWRLHSGSVEWPKIKAWVLATQRWVEHSVARSCHYKPQPMENTQAGLNSLLVTTGLKPNSRIYKVEKDLRQVGKHLLRRWKHFNLPRDLKKQPKAA